jgi:hypothetical protein
MVQKTRRKFAFARVYRDRAEKLRTISEGLTLEVQRQLLIDLADDYVLLAKSIEAQA